MVHPCVLALSGIQTFGCISLTVTLQIQNIPLPLVKPGGETAMTSSSAPARAFGSSASSKLSKGRNTGTSVSEQMVGELSCHWECVSCCSGKMQNLCLTQQSWVFIICPHFLPQTAVVWNALGVNRIASLILLLCSTWSSQTPDMSKHSPFPYAKRTLCSYDYILSY